MTETMIQSLWAQPRARVLEKLPTEVMAEKHKRWEVDLEARVGRHDLVWGEPHGPASNWTQGAFLGNGDLGAAVYGYPDNYTLALGKADLWDRRDPGRGSLPQGTFADLRRCYEEQDQAEYDRLAATMPLGRLPTLIPAGVLRLRVAETAIHASCTQRLSLYRGISETTFLPSGQCVQTQLSRGAPTTIRTLLSQPHDVLALRMLPGVYPLGPMVLEYARSPEPDVDPPEIRTEGSVALVHYRLPAGDSYVVALWLSAGEVEWHQPGYHLLGDLQVPEGELVLYATLVTEADTDDPTNLAQERLEAARAAGIEAVEESHQKWWSNFWQRSYATIEDEAVERGWYRGLYLCGSCLRPGKQSPGLQGAWIKERHPAWRADFHGNINIQALYWGCFTANRLDLFEPYLACYLSILPRCRRDAREFFGMDGVYLPHSSDIFGNPLANMPCLTLMSSATPSCWLASMFWDYYAYTQDRDFLREIGYPLLREVTLFTEDYVQIDAEDRVTIAPSISGEYRANEVEGWGVNSQYDVAGLRRLWELTIRAAEILEVDPEDRARWQRRYARLPDLPQNPETGGWKSFEDKPPLEDGGDWAHYAVFPFEQVSLYHGRRAWLKQALATHDDEVAHDRPLGAWCGGYGGAIAARLGLKQVALELARTSDGPVFDGPLGVWGERLIQVDHAPGMARALGDLLVLSMGGVIHLFPGVPGSISAAFHSLRTEGAFLLSAEKRGEDVAYAIIHSLAGARLRLASPFGSGDPVAARLRCLDDDTVLAAGTYRRFTEEEATAVDLSADNSGNWLLEADTRAGATYVLERTDQILENIPHLEL